MGAKSITIVPVLNGFIVKVGCQEVVITSAKKLGEEVERYYNHPEMVEKEYLETAINKLKTLMTEQPREEPMTTRVGVGIGGVGIGDPSAGRSRQ